MKRESFNEKQIQGTLQIGIELAAPRTQAITSVCYSAWLVSGTDDLKYHKFFETQHYFFADKIPGKNRQ